MQTQYLTFQERRRIRNKTIIIWLSAVLAVAGGIWGVVKLAQSSEPSLQTIGQVPALSASDKVLGNREAPVQIIEYADFQCPSCQAVDPLLKQLVSEYQGKIALVYRNYPLKTIHSTAMIAAAAAEAAGKQGKFWEMHDLLYTNQSQWADKPNAAEIYAGFAQSLGMDVEQFKKDLLSPAIQAQISSNYDTAIGLTLDHTPTFALNGKLIDNPRGYDGFKHVIDRELSK
ncbi:MAG: DsbA family protein [Candidatus Doudnabacteria bacterium]|nr:DsbA family protein [Candidatus Doudnabacteria bacterium]